MTVCSVVFVCVWRATISPSEFALLLCVCVHGDTHGVHVEGWGMVVGGEAGLNN